MKDTFAQTTLNAVIDANQVSTTNFKSIDSDVAAGHWDDVRDSVTSLRPKVAGVNLLTVILIGDISNSLSTIQVKGQIANAGGFKRLSTEDADQLETDINAPGTC
jgi:hypothetical protein